MEKTSKKEKAPIWKRMSVELAKPTRAKREVNLQKISLNTKKDEKIIIPGKLLATGELSHPVTVVAHTWSVRAAEKVKAAGGKVTSIADELKANSKGAKLKIIG